MWGLGKCVSDPPAQPGKLWIPQADAADVKISTRHPGWVLGTALSHLRPLTPNAHSTAR